MHNEREGLLPEVRALLHDLLSQSEQIGRRQVVRVRLNRPDYRWYTAGEELGLKEEANQQLEALADQGFLALHWQKYEEGNLLAAIDLINNEAKDGQSLYHLLERKPLHEMKRALRELLEAQEICEGWFSRCIVWTLTRLEQEKSVAPFQLFDQHTNRDLLLALSALACLQAPILERTLSIELFSNSKRLESLRRPILSVLRTYDPDAVLYGDDDWALLQSHYLYRSPEYLYLEGPLELEIESQIPEKPAASFSLDAELPSIGLSEAILRRALICTCSARGLLTIENWTSFHEMLLVRPPSLLVLYTGGFASPSMISFLQRIRTARPDLPCYHWGDIDVGGFRILAHLRRNMGTVYAVGMDQETLLGYRLRAQLLTEQDRKNIDSLLSNPSMNDCLPLINLLCERGIKLEQEAISPSSLLQHLHL